LTDRPARFTFYAMRGRWVGLGLVVLAALGFLAIDWETSAILLAGAAAGGVAARAAPRLLGGLPWTRIGRIARGLAVAAAVALSMIAGVGVLVVMSLRALVVVQCGEGCLDDVASARAVLIVVVALVLLSAAMITIGRRVGAASRLRPVLNGPNVIAVAGLGLVVGLLVANLGTPRAGAPPPPLITGYVLEVRPSPPGTGTDFDVVAQVKYTPISLPFSPPQQLTLGARHLKSSAGPGLLVREAGLPGPDAFVAAALPEAPQPVLLCPNTCPPVTVDFIDFPRGSVFQVRDGTIDRREPFGDAELVVASITPVGTGGGDIVFSYLPAPYNSLPQPAIDLATDSGNTPKLLIGAIAALAVPAWRSASAAMRSAAAGWLGRQFDRWRGRRSDEDTAAPPAPEQRPPAPRRRPVGRPRRR
jgi:hypothetical protein